MADITNYQAIPIKTLLGDLSTYKYNPALIQRVILDHLEDITSGQIDVVDPSNPFIFLMEASCVNTALAIQEATNAMRKAYPALSQSEEDLYLHMSDQDYVGRFSNPATANFTFYVELNSLLANLVDVPAEKLSRVKIPRNTEVSVDGYTFALQYPIEILKHYTGIFQIKYVTDVNSPLQSLSTNIIDYKLTSDANNVTWVMFTVPLTQFSITSAEFPIQLSRPFIEDIVYPDSYYTARVFYLNSSNEWIEIRTTHTDQVYDPYVATAALTVYSGYLRVFIPPVYILNGLITGNVRVDVYSTKGAIDVNFSNYQVDAFQTKLKAVDFTNDIDTYTNAFSQITYFSVTSEVVSDGSTAIDLMTLRDAVINNSIGDRQLPITQAQLAYTVDTKGFDLYKNIDVVTNRVFCVSKDLPVSEDRFPIPPMLVTLATLISTIQQLQESPSVVSHNNRLTIPSYTLFKLTGSHLSLIEDFRNSMTLTEFLSAVNAQTLLMNPFHYVLDYETNEVDWRAYSLDFPTVDTLNFIYQNTTIGFVVNTNTYTVEKTATGYVLTITTKSGTIYKQMANSTVGAQLVYTPPGETFEAYLNGEYMGLTSDGERVFRFVIETSFDVDSNDWLQLTNFQIPSDSNVVLPTRLTEEFKILHYTTLIPSGFVQSDSDLLLGGFLSDVPIYVSTEESLSIKFGDALSRLWRHYRSAVGGLGYRKYTEDVPMFYDEDVYEIDPKTGLFFSMGDDCTFRTNLLHHKNEIVKDAQGAIVYKYRAGDVMLDANGDPIIETPIDTNQYMDMVMIDYKAFLATRSDHVDYRKNTIKTIVSWIVNDLAELDDILLEQTRLYFTPRRNIGQVLVMVSDGVTQHIDIAQSLKVSFYVKNATYNDLSIRESINYRTVQILSDQLALQRVSISDMIIALKTEFQDTIDTVSITGLGGSYDLKLCLVNEDNVHLALKKLLVRQSDGELVINNDVTIEYIDVELN